MINTIIKRNITLTILFFITVVFTMSSCKDECGENKIVVVEYEPMVRFVRDTPYAFDINSDGINDIIVYYLDRSGYGEFYVKSSNTDICKINNFNYASEPDTIINEELQWVDYDLPVKQYKENQQGNYFLGVRYVDEDSIHYGWILTKRIVQATYEYKAGLYLKKTAFCTVANYEIIFGQEKLYLE